MHRRELLALPEGTKNLFSRSRMLHENILLAPEWPVWGYAEPPSFLVTRHEDQIFWVPYTSARMTGTQIYRVPVHLLEVDDGGMEGIWQQLDGLFWWDDLSKRLPDVVMEALL